MVARPEVLAIVQARGGSKGIPGKNTRFLGDYPLLAYTVASGLAAKTITRLIISTDDEAIAETAQQYGAEVPFFRPAAIATDTATDYPLFEHALQWLEAEEGYQPELIVQLRPTTPLRPTGMIDAAVQTLWHDPQADSVRSVTKPDQNPYKMWRMTTDEYLSPLLASEFAEPYNMPRQQLPQTYWQTGHVDVMRYKTIMQQRSLTGQKVRPIVIDSWYCVDIDTPLDLAMAKQRLEWEEVQIDWPTFSPPMQPAAALPSQIELIVFDFDGVFTDNRVLVLEDGREAVVCNRSDGMGLSLLKQHGFEAVVLSTETNPVVAARCKKLGLDYQHGLSDKATVLQHLVAEKNVDFAHVIYVGNDVNDLGCMRLAGCAIAVADAHPAVLSAADMVLNTPGGLGAVREICDLILRRQKQ